MNWQPIETCKKDDTFVLLWDGVCIDIGRHGGSDRYAEWEDQTGYACLKPTHWMPLPEPPQ